MENNQLFVEKIISDKKKAKKTLAKEFKISHKKPLVAVFIEHELSPKIANRLQELLTGFKVLSVNVMVLADTNLNVLPPQVLLSYDMNNRNLLLDAADMALAFEYNDVEEFLLHGTIPVSLAREELEDYNPNKETGNAFICASDNPWSIFAAFVRAIETFKFPYDWKHLLNNGIKSVK